jgi:hypothetical protein
MAHGYHKPGNISKLGCQTGIAALPHVLSLFTGCGLLFLAQQFFDS